MDVDAWLNGFQAVNDGRFFDGPVLVVDNTKGLAEHPEMYFADLLREELDRKTHDYSLIDVGRTPEYSKDVNGYPAASTAIARTRLGNVVVKDEAEEEAKFWDKLTVIQQAYDTGMSLAELVERIEKLQQEISQLKQEMAAREDLENFLSDNPDALTDPIKRERLRQKLRAAGMKDLESYTKPDGTVDATKLNRDVQGHGRQQQQQLEEREQELHERMQEYEQRKSEANHAVAHQSSPQAEAKIIQMAQTEQGREDLIGAASRAGAIGQITVEQKTEIYRQAGMSESASKQLANAETFDDVLEKSSEDEFMAFLDGDEMEQDSAPEDSAQKDIAVVVPMSSFAEQEMGDSGSFSKVSSIGAHFAARAAGEESAPVVVASNDFTPHAIRPVHLSPANPALDCSSQYS
ncbi:MAG: hypothetical protein KDI13_08885 [Alphaproteobacteria bacterium]|nr:hypothetical protein [Alphaproteobacteria bacterium]